MCSFRRVKNAFSIFIEYIFHRPNFIFWNNIMWWERNFYLVLSSSTRSSLATKLLSNNNIWSLICRTANSLKWKITILLIIIYWIKKVRGFRRRDCLHHNMNINTSSTHYKKKTKNITYSSLSMCWTFLWNCRVTFCNFATKSVNRAVKGKYKNVLVFSFK